MTGDGPPGLTPLREPMFRHLAAISLLLSLMGAVCFSGTSARAQMTVEPPLVFGYFQNTLSYLDAKNSFQPDYTSFSMQQLNVMMQKELTPQWAAFVNMEFVNSYSSSRMWGEFNLEEAWVRYRITQRLNLKMGLHIPEFNRMNTIKTKMPLLPYIIRPLVYEASVSENVSDNEYVPNHAYVSLYGTVPAGRVTIDHALYAGNSPNTSTIFGGQQSAVDTSKTFLTGGRLGIRTEAIQAGVSGSLDFIDYPAEIRNYIKDSVDIQEVPRYRFGADLRLSVGPLTFEGEMIKIMYDDDISEIAIDKEFYYATILYDASERLTVYGGYWYTAQDLTDPDVVGLGFELVQLAARQKIPVVGAAYQINDRVVAKGQFGRLTEEIDDERYSGRLANFYYYAIATSVMF